MPPENTESPIVSLEDLSHPQRLLSKKRPKSLIPHIVTTPVTTEVADKSLGTIFASSVIFKSKLDNSDDKLDGIIPNFVSKHIKKVCYEIEHQAAKKSIARTSKVNAVDILKPDAREAFAAVVMVDVSGYSKLTATLAERGPVGAELLSRTMKGYLDQILETIVNYGGDVVKFAGTQF